METMHAGDVFAEIVAAFAAGLAEAAGARTVDGCQLARQDTADAGTDRLDHAGGFRTDHERHLALGERHAAPAPDVDVIERDGLDAQRHLTWARCIRLRQVDDFKLAVFDELQCAHDMFP
jgi:hypothetical protein